jgi:hypothetical protein
MTRPPRNTDETVHGLKKMMSQSAGSRTVANERRPSEALGLSRKAREKADAIRKMIERYRKRARSD